MGYQRAGLVFIFSFVLVSLFGVSLSRRPPCINSTSIHRIDTVGIAHETVFSCQMNRDVPYPAHLKALLPDLNRRVIALEAAFSRQGLLFPQLRVEVNFASPYAFEQSPYKILIGEKMLEAHGHFERAMIAAAMDLDSRRTIQWRKDVLADLFISILFGDMDLHDPIFSREVTLLDEVPKMTELESACTSLWRASSTYQNCIENSASSAQAGSFHATLRGVFTSALVASFKTLHFGDRAFVARRLAVLLPNVHALTQENQVTADPDQLAGMFDQASEFEQELELRIGRLGDPGDRWITELHHELRLRSVPLPSGRLMASAIIYDNRHNTEGLLVESEKRDPRYAVVKTTDSGATVQFPPSREVFPGVNRLQSDLVVVIQCGDIRFGDIIEKASDAQKAVLIRSCRHDVVLMDGLLRQDLMSFSKQNSQLDFVYFDIPSLSAAGLPKENFVWQQLSQEKPRMALQKILGWQNIEHWSDIGLSRPSAVNDGIEWFRFHLERSVVIR